MLTEQLNWKLYINPMQPLINLYVCVCKCNGNIFNIIYWQATYTRRDQQYENINLWNTNNIINQNNQKHFFPLKSTNHPYQDIPQLLFIKYVQLNYCLYISVTLEHTLFEKPLYNLYPKTFIVVLKYRKPHAQQPILAEFAWFFFSSEQFDLNKSACKQLSLQNMTTFPKNTKSHLQNIKSYMYPQVIIYDTSHIQYNQSSEKKIWYTILIHPHREIMHSTHIYIYTNTTTIKYFIYFMTTNYNVYCIPRLWVNHTKSNPKLWKLKPNR